MVCKVIISAIIYTAYSLAHETCLATESNEENPGKQFSKRIMLGDVSKKGEFPFIVSLQKGGEHFCGGAIIHPEWILTANHCMEKAPMSKIVDGVNVIGEGNTHEILKIKHYFEEVEEDPYIQDMTLSHDITLLKVTPPFKMSNVTQAAKLPIRHKEVPGGTPAKVAGWGITKPSGPGSKILKKLSVVIYNKEECKKIYWRFSLSTIEDQQICAMDKEGRGTTGFGDSGGPLFIKENELIGIVSWGRSSTVKRVPTIYAKVSYYMEWIDRTLAWQ